MLLGLLPIACVLEDDGIASVEWDSKVTRRVDATRIFEDEVPIEKHRIYWRYVSLWTLLELGLTDFGNIPKVYPNLLLDLRDFIATSRREVAPSLREKDEWRFWMPPGLNADRGIISSASDAADHASAVYKGTGIEVKTLTGNPPKWEGGCQLYQISTGRYSLWQGLLNKKKKFKPQARRMVNLIEQTADAGVKCLVVAPIAFIQAAGTKKLREHPNVTLINHHHQDCDIVFVFHYEPKPDVIEAQAKRIYRNATDLSIDYELNRISDVIEMCCDLIDRSADGQSLTILERVNALEGLFSSSSNFVENSSEKLRALEAKWKAEGVNVDALYRESYPEKTPLKIMISLLLEAMLEK